MPYLETKLPAVANVSPPPRCYIMYKYDFPQLCQIKVKSRCLLIGKKRTYGILSSEMR